ncbi:MAG TPA: gamma-glutamyltransferase [Gemmatimonadaceae bacterium]|jgi:gamma-glutamyltranspeptidase/glutathione hydrolase|nr:gamma-glutamyltransferase [Gemmatimonadaceae bacterium]
MPNLRFPSRHLLVACLLALGPAALQAQRARRSRPAQPRQAEDPRYSQTEKPPLHATHWLAITGKPLSATAGALIFAEGGNAVDAAAAMLAAGCTMWDTLSCGGETQALIYNPHTGKVIGIDALGVAPTGATADFYHSKGYRYPPEYGPLAAVTPGTVGGLLTMLAEYGTLSLKQVLAPAIQMADGYAMEAQLARTIQVYKDTIAQWQYSRAVMFTHPGTAHPGPEAGEIFVQKDLAATWRKLVQAEQDARKAGKTRKQAIYAAYDRFYKGDIAHEIVRGMREEGGLFTLQDLANWKVRIEEPLHTSYKGIEVYKLPIWQQGPVMLQALNILENTDVKDMGYNSTRYIHTLYQTMNLAYADRDFYYGDPYFPPQEPVQGLLSKAYAKQRFQQIDWAHNDSTVKPGDPYPFQGGVNPFKDLLAEWNPLAFEPKPRQARSGGQDRPPAARDTNSRMSGAAEFLPDVATAQDSAFTDAFYKGTTSIEAADAEGWVVSVTPSGGWVPAVIAGHTGIGLSQRAQSFVTYAKDGPYNVIEPGKKPRVTLTPTLALKDGKPYLAMAVQGGDSQDQNLLQFFLNVVEFGMTVQEACEAPNINSYQMRSSFGLHENEPGRMMIATSLPDSTRRQLEAMGYRLMPTQRTSGPINAIYFDWAHHSMWGGSSNHGEDYGIAW